jgi:hypothetical protein
MCAWAGGHKPPGLGVASLKHLRAHVALKCAFAGAGVNKKGGGGKGGGKLEGTCSFEMFFCRGWCV